MGKCKLLGNGSPFRVTNGELKKAKAVSGVIPPYTFVQHSTKKTDQFSDLQYVDAENRYQQVLRADSYKNYVYLFVSRGAYYYIYIGKISGTTLTIEKIVNLGDNAVSICTRGNRLFVLSSEGGDATITTYSIGANGLLTKLKSVPVAYETTNPYDAYASDICALPGSNVMAFISFVDTRNIYIQTVVINDDGSKGTVGTVFTIKETSYEKLYLFGLSANSFALVYSYFDSDNSTISLVDVYTLSGKVISKANTTTLVNGTSTSSVKAAKLVGNNIILCKTIERGSYKFFAIHASPTGSSKTWSKNTDQASMMCPMGSSMFCIGSGKVDSNYNYRPKANYYQVQLSGAIVGAGTYNPTTGQWSDYVSDAVDADGTAVFLTSDDVKNILYGIVGPKGVVGLIPATSVIEGITSTKATTEKEGKYFILDTTKALVNLAIPEEYINSIKDWSVSDIQSEVWNNANE